MPTLPWINGRAKNSGSEGGTAVVFASRLPVRGRLTPPAFLWGIVQIVRQLRTADGLLGYSLKAQLISGTYWTVSAWADESSLHRFVGDVPHKDIAANLASSLGDPTFVQWETEAVNVPVTWDVATERLAAADRG